LETKQTDFESLNLAEVDSIHSESMMTPADNGGASVGSFKIIIVVCQKCDFHHSIP